MCFGHIYNHPHGQENYTQKYINKSGFDHGIEILQFLDKMFNYIIHWLIYTQFKASIFETVFLCVNYSVSMSHVLS